MAKSKALLIALGGSVVGILGYFLPWITVNMFTECSISGFSLLRMLFGTGSGNVLQELGYSSYFIVPAILLVLALIALSFTGVSSALMLRSNTVTKTSGILLTIVSGIVFLLVAGIALLVSTAIGGQGGSYVDVGSYIRYGAGFFITSLGALAVIISGILIFRGGSRSESISANYSAEGQKESLWVFDSRDVEKQNKVPANNLPPVPGPGLIQPPQGYSQGQAAAWNRSQFQPAQTPPQQPYSGPHVQPWQAPQSPGRTAPPALQMRPQLPYNQTPPQPGPAVPNQGWHLPPKPTSTSPWHFQPASAGELPQPFRANQNMVSHQQPIQPPQNTPFNPTQPWSGDQQPGPNNFDQQPPQVRQNNSQGQAPQNHVNQQRPLDKPWERVRYNGSNQVPQTSRRPTGLPLQNPRQGRVCNPLPNPPFLEHEDSNTSGDYTSPLEDPEITRCGSDLDNEILTEDDNVSGS